MRLRLPIYLLSAFSLFAASAQVCSAKNWDVNVGGSQSYGDGYGGDYSTAVLTFQPSTLTINQGDTVTFHGLGGAAHNVHADDNSFRCAKGCDNDGSGGNGAPDDSAWTSTVTFNTPGVVKFHCDQHQSMGMVGAITVNAVAAAGPPITGATSGSWFDPTQNGHGFSIQIAPGNIFIAYWFVYSPDGTQQAWVIGSGAFTPGSNTATVEVAQQVGAKFPPNFDAAALTTTDWGSLTFTFTDCSNGTVTWASKLPAYASGTLPITKIIGVDTLNCTN